MVSKVLADLRAFVAPFHDPRAWSLIFACAGLVWLVDPVMAKTQLTWALQAGEFAGLAVIGCRQILPQIGLSRHVGLAEGGNVASGLVVLGVCITMAAIMVSFAIFARVM